MPEEVFLKHILDEINFLMRETAEIKFDELMKNEVLKRACARSLEIIGEAAKNIPADFKKRYKNVEWKKLCGLRDKIIHYYFGVNWNILWDVIKKQMSKLKGQMESILKETRT